jgi:hypothetical protein
VSQAIVLAPSTGGLGYDITLAQSLAGYNQDVAQGQAQTLNLGAIGLSLTSDQCNGNPPTVKSSDLPPAVTVESSNAASQQQTTLVPAPSDTGIGAGVEQAQAAPTPSSSATTTLASLDLSSAVDVSGAVVRAQSAVVANAARVAEATADIAKVSLLDGLVVLDGLHWQAVDRTGSGAANGATFTLGGVTVAGKSIPVGTASIDQVASVIDTALAPTGLQIALPTETFNAADGTVTETPLSIGIDHSALGHEIVGPQLGTLQPLRDAIDNALLGVDCEFGVPLLLADIASGAVAGGGALEIELGGAQASTTDAAAIDPFDAFGAIGLGGFGAGSGSGALAGGGSSGSGGGFGGVGGGYGAAGGTTAAGVGGGSTSAGSTASGGGVGANGSPRVVATTTSCRSLGTAGGGCGGGDGDALPVGLAGLAALGAVGTADVVRLRRFRRLTAEATP